MTWVDKFAKVAERIENALGHPISFGFAVGLIFGWLLTGKYYEWSELFINTVTTIITFLLGFLILNSSIRNGRAEQLKLDEIISALKRADNKLISLESKSRAEVKQIENEIRVKREEM